MKTPSVFLSVDPESPAVTWREQPLHVSQVRLVYPIRDPNTGIMKDTVIANIAQSRVYHDKMTGKRRWTRYVAGTDIAIPWPEVPEPEYTDHDADTRIMEVETRSFVPTLLKPPMPLEVIDELRAKYSKFRTRHDKEFRERVEREETERRERLEMLKRMARTPLQEANRKLREEKKKLGEPVMSDEVKEMIGKVMAQNRPDLLERIQA